jgi:hypothetical protein
VLLLQKRLKPRDMFQNTQSGIAHYVDAFAPPVVIPETGKDFYIMPSEHPGGIRRAISVQTGQQFHVVRRGNNFTRPYHNFFKEVGVPKPFKGQQNVMIAEATALDGGRYEIKFTLNFKGEFVDVSVSPR